MELPDKFVGSDCTDSPDATVLRVKYSEDLDVIWNFSAVGLSMRPLPYFLVPCVLNTGFAVPVAELENKFGVAEP